MCWWLDGVRLRPGELLFEGETTAIALPAFLGPQAVTWPILAGERAVGGLELCQVRPGQGEPESNREVAEQRKYQRGVTESSTRP